MGGRSGPIDGPSSSRTDLAVPAPKAQVKPLVQGEPACKPASVPREVPGWRPSIWDRRCRRPRAVHQGTRPGQPPRPRRRDRYVPYSTLLRVGFAEPTGHPAAGALLPHRFTLAVPLARGGGLFSVALSCGSPRLAVSQHPALWRPDFPRSRRTGTAAAQPAPPAPQVCHPNPARRVHTGSMGPDPGHCLHRGPAGRAGGADRRRRRHRAVADAAPAPGGQRGRRLAGQAGGAGRLAAVPARPGRGAGPDRSRWPTAP